MIIVRNFQSAFCNFWDGSMMCKHLQSAQDLDIWKIPFKGQIQMTMFLVQSAFNCEECFVAGFWMCLLFAFVGFIEAVVEFVRVYSIENYRPKTFWNRSYQHIPVEYRSKARIVGSAVNIAANQLFLYGILCFKIGYFYPWIIINGAVAVLEIFYFTTTAISNKSWYWKPCFSVLFLIVRFGLVFNVMLAIKRLSR